MGRLKRKESDTDVHNRLRGLHSKRAEVKSWGLWGWVRDNKHSLTSERAIKRIDEVIKYATQQCHNAMTEALELAESRLRRTLAAEEQASKLSKEKTEATKTAKSQERVIRALKSRNKKLSERLKHATVVMAKNGDAKTVR